MAILSGKSLKLIACWDKKSDPLFFHSTLFKVGRFRMRDNKFGNVISLNESDRTLEETLRGILKNYDKTISLKYPKFASKERRNHVLTTSRTPGNF